MPGEARRRRHGISGIPVTADSTVKCNTRPSSPFGLRPHCDEGRVLQKICPQIPHGNSFSSFRIGLTQRCWCFKPQLIVARKRKYLTVPIGVQLCPLRAGRAVGEAAAAGPARGLVRRRQPPQLSREICRVVGGDIERSTTLMPHFQSEGRVTIDPSNSPITNLAHER